MGNSFQINVSLLFYSGGSTIWSDLILISYLSIISFIQKRFSTRLFLAVLALMQHCMIYILRRPRRSMYIMQHLQCSVRSHSHNLMCFAIIILAAPVLVAKTERQVGARRLVCLQKYWTKICIKKKLNWEEYGKKKFLWTQNFRI